VDNSIKISYDTLLVTHDMHIEYAQRLAAEIQKIRAARTTGYDNGYSFVRLPADEMMRREIKKIGQEKKALNPALMIVIGIGGSSVGMEAIFHALYGTEYNRTPQTLLVYVADTVDADYLYLLMSMAESLLKQGENILLFVASKSGTTVETVANFSLFLSLLMRYKKQYQEFVVVATDEHSPLWDSANAEGYACFAIPKMVGGRYSVLSAVGLFPLYMLNGDIDAVCAGAEKMTDLCTTLPELQNNPAALRAAFIYALYEQKYTIHTMFLFGRCLKSVGQWYKQLMGESIGKEYNLEGKRVNCGITPVVSVGSNDLHSVAQLYLAGPYNTATTFVSVAHVEHDMCITHQETQKLLLSYLDGKSVHDIMQTILQATMHAYEKNNRPFMHIELPSLSPYYLGQLLQMHMIEMVYLASLLQVNPFDQPNVEGYKQEMRELLMGKQ
jgi:glucose-6-phosphate isomerase